MAQTEIEETRKKVLFITLAGWYPTKSTPAFGAFVREHARAASLFDDVSVLHTAPGEFGKGGGVFRIDEIMDGKMRDVLVEYKQFGLYDTAPTPDEGKIAAGSKKGNEPARKKKESIVGTLREVASTAYASVAVYAGFRHMLRLGWRPDVIHAVNFKAGFAAIVIGWVHRIPVVITEHYLYMPPREHSKWDILRARFAIGFSKIAFPPSKAYCDSLRYYHIGTKAIVIPNTVDTEVFYPPSIHERHDQKKLLFVGHISEKKNLDSLLRALGRILKERGDFHLEVIGDGPRRGEYEELARSLGLESHVTFRGRLVKEQIADYMRDCDLFVMPSLYEGFGVVYIEAMACGKPVIATNSRGPDEIVTKEVGMLVDPYSLDQIQNAIEYMLDNHQKYDSDLIARYAKDNFGYAAVGAKLHEAYLSVA